MTRGNFVTIIIALSFWIIYSNYSDYLEKKELKQTISSIQSFYENEKSSFQAGKELVANDIKEMKQLLVSTSSELGSLKEQYKGFSKIQSVVKTEIHSSVKDIKIPFSQVDVSFPDSLVPKDLIDKFYIAKNSKSSYFDDWIDLEFTIGDSLEIDSINVRNKIDAVLGWKKSDKSFSFLRKKEPVVEIISYSPYTKIGYLNNLTVKPENKSKFISTITSKPIMFGLGVLGGIFITSQVLK